MVRKDDEGGGIIRFDPSSWDKGAERVEYGSLHFVYPSRITLSGMDISATGADASHGTIADMAIATVFPVAIEAMLQTAEGINAGFSNIATGMRETGDAYRGIEEVNADASSTVMED